jgi:hypothetical protein
LGAPAKNGFQGISLIIFQKLFAMKKLIKFVLAAMFVKGVIARIRKPHIA